MKKICFFILILTLFCGVAVFAQSADKVTEMIESQTVTLTDVAYFASTYLSITGDEIEEDIALAAIEKHFPLSKIPRDDKNLNYAEFAYFCTQVWDIKGGIMLRITESPRYALRELQSMGFISSSKLPKNEISGTDALTIMSQCIDYSIEKGTIDLEAFSSSSVIDFQSSFSR